MIQFSPSAMMPIGAMCPLPLASAVMTIVSRIIGISISREATQRVAHLAQAREIFRRTVDRAAPVQRLVLGVALAEPPGDFRLHQLGAEIKRVRRVLPDAEMREKRKRVLRHPMAGAVVDVDAVLGDLDAEIGIG